MKKILPVLTLALVLGWSNSALASLWGNPLPEYKPGQVVVGGGGLLGDTNYLLGEYGLSKEGTVRGHYGIVDWKGVLGGSEFGAGYKHDLGNKFKLGDYSTSLGVMGYYTTGSVKDSTGDFKASYTMMDFGAGVSIQPKPKLKVYGMGILSMWKSESTYVAPSYTYYDPFTGRNTTIGGGTYTDSYSENDFGVSAGVEYEMSPQLILGAELHGGFYENDDSLRLFALYKL
ncbi:MAG: hypothetical protein OEW39_13135 [Deltaproteobacteria bacterium]|nr:hypothetical protein [Deltaproteobacteria bacterium]